MKVEVSISPHIYSKLNIKSLMREVIVALIPSIIFSIYLFRFYALKTYLSCILGAILSEEIFTRLVRKKSFIVKDNSALLTGILLAMCLPPKIPFYVGFIGASFSIIVGKQLFGGLGCNIFNPALIGRAFLMSAYPVYLTTWINPLSLDTVTSATPLSLWKFDKVIVPLKNLFIGVIPGSLGETSSLLLILGGIYLLIKKIIDFRIPLSMILSLMFFSFIFKILKFQDASVFFHLFSGGFMLGCFFMATDPVTTPITRLGRYIFGVFCSLFIMIIRIWGGYPEAVMFSILFMNALTPLINKLTFKNYD